MTKSLDSKVRQMINKGKPIVCTQNTFQAFIENKQNYIGIRIDGIYYYYVPKSKTQIDKIRYYNNFSYEVGN